VFRVAQQWSRLKGRRAVTVVVTSLAVVAVVGLGCSGPGNGGWDTSYVGDEQATQRRARRK
jgi:hypothetical protein